MLNILGKTFYVLFILLLVAVAGLFLTTLLPITGNIQVKIVKSGSMEPAISTGSIVVVRPAAVYEAGDIITFGKDTRDQIPTTHRVLEVLAEGGNTAYQTKGDANEEADPQTVPASTVIGKVWFHVPYAGFVLDFARQPLGFTFMIGIPAGIIILDELIRIWMEVTGMRRRKRKGGGVETAADSTGSPHAEKIGTRTSILNVPPSRPGLAAMSGISEFRTPQRVKANETLDLKKRLMADENTLDLSKIWGTRESQT